MGDLGPLQLFYRIFGKIEEPDSMRVQHFDCVLGISAYRNRLTSTIINIEFGVVI